jgi:phospholipid/cholesterol/gamma-HCH transport system substrate-binding protein
MATKLQKVRLALFFIVSGGVLAGFLLFTAGLHLLKKREYYFIEFNDMSVGGLNPGAAVKYQGVQIGRVEDRSISPEDFTIVVVEISVRPDMANAIRTDTQARLSSQGITGIKQIELIAGSREAELLPPGSKIQVGETFLSDLDQRAQVLTNKIEQVLNNVILLTSKENSIQFGKTLHSGGSLMENADQLFKENREPIHQTLENLALVTRNLERATSSLQATMDSLHQMLTGDEAHSTLGNLHLATRHVRQQLEGPLPELIANMNRMTQNIDKTFTHIDLTVLSSRNNILDAMQELNETMQNVREATELIREDPSVLIRGRGGE